MKKIILFLILLTSISFGLLAQTIEVRGIVKSTTGTILTSQVQITLEGGGEIARAPNSSPNEFVVIVKSNSTLLFHHQFHEVTRFVAGAQDQAAVQITMEPLPPDFQAPQAPTNENIDALINDLNAMPEGTAGPAQNIKGGLRQLLIDLGIPTDSYINDAWKTSNGGYSATFRSVILENYVHKQPEISNWFAACATLAGTFDQVLIDSKQIKEKLGYWQQFSNGYNLTDVSLFNLFKFRTEKFLFKKDDSGLPLLRILNTFGPIVLAAPGVDKAIVLTEVNCDQNWDCYVYALDYAPTASGFSNSSAATNNSTTFVQPGTPIPFGGSKKYTHLGKVGSGTEIRLTIPELFSKFNSRTDMPIELLIGIESKMHNVSKMTK